MSRVEAVVDCETTGLNDRIHWPYEVALWRDEWHNARVYDLPHSLDHADPVALQIGQYHERGFTPLDESLPRQVERLRPTLVGVTLVGANVRFDAGMIRKVLGYEPWHHRLIDVEAYAMPILGLDEPVGLAELSKRLIDLRGHDIPTPDHTAMGDVRTTKAVWEALKYEGEAMREMARTA